MESLRLYLQSILASALVCSVILMFPLSGTAKEITRLICGLVMSISVITPLRDYDFTALPNSVFDISFDANTLTEEGKDSARNAMAQIIKTEAETYIQNKAAELGVDLSATIRIREDDLPIPISATIYGEVTDSFRTLLEKILFSELGIAKEDIRWIG